MQSFCRFLQLAQLSIHSRTMRSPSLLLLVEDALHDWSPTAKQVLIRVPAAVSEPVGVAPGKFAG